MLQKIINFFIYLIVFSLPLYLVRFKISWVSFNLSEMMIYSVFVIWLFSKFKSMPQVSSFKFQVSGYGYPIFLIFLGVTLSTWFSVDLLISAGIWKSWFIAPLLFFLMVISNIKTKEQVRNILTVLFLSGIGVALIALFYWLNGNLTYDGRLRAFYLSPNHLAMYLSPILIFSLYLYVLAQERIYKILLAIGYWLLAVIIYLTYSYGAWLGLLAALVFLLITQIKQNKILFVLVSFLVLLIIFSFISQIPSQKFQTLIDFSRSSLESRLMIWQSAWTIIKDHPWLGIGPGMFQKYYLDYQPRFEPYLEWAVPQPQNIFLAFWLQTGLLGLIGFIWLLIRFFGRVLGVKLPKFGSLTPKSEELSFILAAVMIYALVHGLVDTTYWKNDLAIIFWLVIGLSCIANRLFYSPRANNPL